MNWRTRDWTAYLVLDKIGNFPPLGDANDFKCAVGYEFDREEGGWMRKWADCGVGITSTKDEVVMVTALVTVLLTELIMALIAALVIPMGSWLGFGLWSFLQSCFPV